MSQKTDQLAQQRQAEIERQRGAKKKPPHDLDSEHDQREILNPQPIEVKLAGETVKLYPLSGYAARSLLGLAGELFTDRSRGGGEPRFRLMQPIYLARFLPLLAIAHEPAGEMEPENVDKIARELDAKLATARGGIELGLALDAMVDQNGIPEALRPPKTEPAPKPAT